MTTCDFTRFLATASRDSVAYRPGGKAALAAHRATFRPHRIRIVVRPGSRAAAFRVRCGGGQQKGTNLYVEENCLS